jgi:type IV secretory pathway VirB2 component (pilin)
MTNNSFKFDKGFRFSILIFFSFFYLITPEVFAADVNNNMLVTTMCNVIKLVTGKAGKAFAAFAVISVGIGFFTGKVSWGLMIGVAAGIAAMFGAPTIVAAISSGTADDCT